MLIQIGNTYVNTAHIVTVKHLRTKLKEHEQRFHHTLYIDLIGGERVSHSYESSVAPWEIGQIQDALQPKVAATAGFYVLQLYDEPEGDDPGYSKLAVVAWAPLGDISTPLCVEELRGSYAILYPDGRVIEPDGPVYRSEAQWHAVELAAHKAKQAQERSAAST